MTQNDYLAWMATADCVLDTPHYSGGANSTYDVFAVGAPVVTLTGNYHRGRYTTAAYNVMGITDCVAKSADEYVDIALRLASERNFRNHCRRLIAERREALFGNLTAVKELEDWLLGAIARVR
jgi:protein O-GlcNAc transferase